MTKQFGLNKKRFFIILGILITIGLILPALLANGASVDGKMSFIKAFLFLFFGFGILFSFPLGFIFFSYFLNDYKTQLIIDPHTRTITVKRGENTTVISREKVLEVFHVNVSENSSRNFMSHFDYIAIILEEKNKIFITNLIIPPKKIIVAAGFKYTEINRIIPYISRSLGESYLTSAEYKEKVKEFEVNFQEYSKEQLQQVISEKGTYEKFAQEAAANILKKRMR